MNGIFKVIWKRSVIEHTLAGIVLKAMERGDNLAPITFAMNQIDKLLSTAPHLQGESRQDTDRVLIVPPLTVTFEIHEEEKIVFIIGLHYRPITFE